MELALDREGLEDWREPWEVREPVLVEQLHGLRQVPSIRQQGMDKVNKKVVKLNLRIKISSNSKTPLQRSPV